MPATAASPPTTIFLLSPARCGSARAQQLANGDASHALAQALRSPEGAELGAVFAFLSALYFRGKLSYARAFARPPRGVSGVLVITPGDGLCDASERIDAARLRAFGACEVHNGNSQFALPLLRDASALASAADSDTRFVLLGSIASAKYVTPLQQALDGRLLFPSEFVGRGDMSRGGLLLRSAADNCELEYRPVAGAVLRGPRPARLPKRPRADKAL